MRIVIPSKCAVRLFNPSDGPTVVEADGVRVSVDASEMAINNGDHVEIRPSNVTDEGVVYLRK